MDASLFKKHITQRGFTYNYFRVSAEAGKPTLVLLHGFPSSSWDWHYQVDFFKPRGYGLVVPDMLGYAGTDKPTDAKFYIGSGLAQDIVDILDKEDVQKSVLIGHDWGSRVVSRLANNHPDRFTAIGFLALAYLPPNPVHDPAAQSARIKQLVGRDLFGYWDYLAEEGADKMIKKNFNSFLSIFFSGSGEIALKNLCPPGALKEWIEANNQGPIAPFLTVEDQEHYRQTLLGGGLASPVAWYKIQTTAGSIRAEDDKLVPKEAYDIQQPVFFGAALRDIVCLPALGNALLKQYAKGPLTVKEFDAGHWVLLSHPKEVNEALLEWIEGLQI
ncbi:epoxide hydrolase [Heterobasidion irregulare TC 32-1]|uniref:Epoxide hydrolase n=1 Tax=Heterobasidion irregulare (strain TC 32-1) TaxID=747525 RepID=W4JUK0_HETIT|nr:epoxide hydrolase [Heterobasidion irregulare TC 32-1]ETW76561.1 epoxide hydrolase [Heterobasidion irregulare TC 32-1]